MDLITGYDTTRMTMRGRGFGPVGTHVVDAIERARRARRPARTTLFYGQTKQGSLRQGSGSSGPPPAPPDGTDPSPTPPADPTGTYQTGMFGEEVVADGLERAGWHILGHRVRTKVGELDLIARRGDTIIFVEVKTAGPRRLAVEETVGARQRLRCRRAAVAWMASNPRAQRGVRHYRFDVFIVRRADDGAVTRIDQVKDAF